MSAETTILEEGEIKITNLRAIFGDKTYAVSNISAVEMQSKPPSLFPALIGILGGVLVLIAIPSLLNNRTWDNNYTALVIGLVLAIYSFLTVRAAKTQYIISFTSSSGEVKAFASPNEEQINRIVQALNDAIIQKG